MRLLILNTQEPNLNAHLTQAVADGFVAVLGKDRVYVAHYSNACALFRQARCDAFLAFDGQGIRTPIVKELLRQSPLNILWTTEDPYELPINTRHAAWFDYVFTNDRSSVADYGGKAIHLPLGAPQYTDGDVPMPRRYRDVFFAGTAWPNRVKIIRDLIPCLTGVKFQFFLPYNVHVPKPRLPTAEHEWNVRLSNDDFLTAARHSKIVLYLERDYSTSGSRSRADSPANRLFEIAALGVAQVAVADEAAVAPYFEPGKEIIVAPNAEEAARAIRELLAAPERLKSLAEAARQRALSGHTYARRAGAIVERVTCCPARRPELAIREAQPLRVLLVAHGVRGQRPWGGTELHVDQIQKGLGDKFDFHHLFARPHGHRTAIVLRHCKSGREQILHTGTYNHHRQWIDPERDAAFQRVLLEEDIHLVHFVHFLNHSLGYVEVARALGRPSVLGLYDFFPACPQFNLMDCRGKFCDLPVAETCDECLQLMAGLPEGTQSARRQLMCGLFQAADKVHFLSHSQRELLQRVVPIADEKAFVQGIGIPPAVRGEAPPPPPPLRVAIIGNVARNKGADTVISLVRRLASDQIHFDIAGDVLENYRRPLERLRGPGVTLHGPYEPERIGSILQGCHVALFASPWPETYCITLSEAFRAGAVPVAPALGAFAERIRDGENGLLVSGDVGSYMRALLSLRDDPALLLRLRNGVAAGDFLTLAEDLGGIASVYEELAAQYHLPGPRRTVALDRDSLSPISVAAVGPLPSLPLHGTISAYRQALYVYRTQGARAVVRKVWDKAAAWRRSA